jgi:hypothetical protein
MPAKKFLNKLMLDSYTKNKTEIISRLAELGKIAGSEHVKIASQSIRTKLEADVFSLVVVGQFKRGKRLLSMLCSAKNYCRLPLFR